MKRILGLALCVILFYQAKSNGTETFFKNADSFLSNYVEDGLIKYKSIHSKPNELQEIIETIEKFNLEGTDEDVQLAFYINAYNLWVIHKIIEKYPVGSPMEIGGFFDQNKIIVAGETMTLNDLENKKIRKIGDARVHFVLVCAALSCPKIAEFAYQPKMLDEQLSIQTRKALDDPGFLMTDSNKLKISEIFNWYRQDFGKSDKELIKFINTYRTEKVPEKARLSYYTYDWTLNEKE